MPITVSKQCIFSGYLLEFGLLKKSAMHSIQVKLSVVFAWYFIPPLCLKVASALRRWAAKTTQLEASKTPGCHCWHLHQFLPFPNWGFIRLLSQSEVRRDADADLRLKRYFPIRGPYIFLGSLFNKWVAVAENQVGPLNKYFRCQFAVFSTAPIPRWSIGSVPTCCPRSGNKEPNVYAALITG